MKNQSLLIAAALFCTYFIWGSTYLAIKFGIESFPPFLMAGLRFVVAGIILYGVMRCLGSPNPTRKQWLAATIIGILLPAIGNGTVTYVQQTGGFHAGVGGLRDVAEHRATGVFPRAAGAVHGRRHCGVARHHP